MVPLAAEQGDASAQFNRVHVCRRPGRAQGLPGTVVPSGGGAGRRWPNSTSGSCMPTAGACTRTTRRQWYRLAARVSPIQPRVHVCRRPGRAQGLPGEWYRLAAEQGYGPNSTSGSCTPPAGAAEGRAPYRLAAEQGYARAQYLGVMYATGRGVLKDRILAHIWFNIAGANGHAQAHEIRDTVERELTRAEVTRATELARACMDSDYQSCEP